MVDSLMADISRLGKARSDLIIVLRDVCNRLPDLEFNSKVHDYVPKRFPSLYATDFFEGFGLSLVVPSPLLGEDSEWEQFASDAYELLEVSINSRSLEFKVVGDFAIAGGREFRFASLLNPTHVLAYAYLELLRDGLSEISG